MASRGCDKPIGIFDSGVGGLTVLKELFKQLPNENTVYFGDTARVPYGNRSNKTIIKFTIENTQLLLTFNIKMLVIACNTSSAVALSTIQQNFNIPIVGVIMSGVRASLKTTRTHRIGVIGTETTIGSKAYETAIQSISPKTKVISCACPLFVPLVEEGWISTPVTYLVAKKYLEPLKKRNIDTLLLGCTHYPLLKNVLSDVMGQHIIIVNPGKEIAQEVKKILEYENMLNTSSEPGEHQFLVSDCPAKFIVVGSHFLGRALYNVMQINT